MSSSACPSQEHQVGTTVGCLARRQEGCRWAPNVTAALCPPGWHPRAGPKSSTPSACSTRPSSASLAYSRHGSGSPCESARSGDDDRAWPCRQARTGRRVGRGLGRAASWCRETARRARDGGVAAGRARRRTVRQQRSAVVRRRGRAPRAVAERPGAADRRGRGRHLGHDEGRPDEARPGGQLRPWRPVSGRPAHAEPAAGQRAPDEPGAGRARRHRGAGHAAGTGLQDLGS